MTAVQERLDAVAGVTAAVDRLKDALPGLLAECTDPEATDMAELLLAVQSARIALQALERDAEAECAKAMVGDYAETPTLRVERSRRAERKTWDHEAWKRDARGKVLRKHGLLGAQAVIDAQGEMLSPAAFAEALTELQGVHGSTAPRVTQMRGLGLDPDDYCERTPGSWQVRVLRLHDENAATGEQQ